MGIYSDQRRITRRNIFKYIYDAGMPVSKPQIAEALNLSLPTVYKNIAELLDEGYIRCGELQKSTGGRPPVAYEINSDFGFSIGVAVSENHIRLLASNLSMKELGYKRVGIRSLDSPMIGRQILEESREFMRENALEEERLIGMGITIPGVIDYSTDTVILSPTLRMEQVDLGKVRSEIPYRVVAENDSTCGGYAEWLSLPREERGKAFVYLFLENGVGGAIFFEGKPYLGTNRRSAEFGHICVHPGGRLCNCGCKGCLEAYISTGRFSHELGIQLEDFFEEMEKGNEAYREIWEDGLSHLAVAVNTLRLSYDCDVVLGGTLIDFMEPYMDMLRKKVAEGNPFDREADFLKLGKYSHRAGMRGVSWYVNEKFMEQL